MNRGGPYNDIVRDHFERPRNQRRLEGDVLVGDAHNPVCGDRLRLYRRVDGGRVGEVSFQAQGCPAAIAAGSMVTELLRGRTLTEARAVRDEDVAAALGGLPPGKIHCSVLAEDAIHAALGASA